MAKMQTKVTCMLKLRMKAQPHSLLAIVVSCCRCAQTLVWQVKVGMLREDTVLKLMIPKLMLLQDMEVVVPNHCQCQVHVLPL